MQPSEYLQQAGAWLVAQDLPQWQQPLLQHTSNNLNKAKKLIPLLAELPPTEPIPFGLQAASISFGNSEAQPQNPQLRAVLEKCIPWRKGPFYINGIEITSEWNCAIKWSRIADHLAPLLPESRVLDIGGGNGYYGWRALHAGAATTLVVDPNPLAWIQWLICQHFTQDMRAGFLPCAIESLPATTQSRFEVLLCLGVIYHSPAPFALLRQLRKLIKPGGSLVIESIVIAGNANTVLTPKGRYACMPNVWAIPSVDALKRWLERCGYSNIRLIAKPQATTSAEQAASAWSQPFSLIDSLDQEDKSLTVEGYPAPQRAIFMADPHTN